MSERTVKVPAISCQHCVATIRREIAEIGGVKSVEGNPASKQITVRWEEPASWQLIADTLGDLGYPPED